MEDEESDGEPTLEEIISSVLKTKSKFGKVKLTLPPLRRHRANNPEKEDPVPENKGSFKAKTEEPRLYLLQNDKAKGSGNINSLTHLDHKREKSVGERDAIRCKEDLGLGSCAAHHGSWSTSKMKHSLSTPEVRSKYIQKDTTTKGSDDSKLSVIRQVNFSRMTNNSNVVGDKENTDPVAVPHDGSKGRSTTNLDAVNKDLHQKSLELSCKPFSNSLDKNSEEIKGGIESKVYNTQFQSISKEIKKPFDGEVLLKKGETFLSPENKLKENDQTDESGSLHSHISSQQQSGLTDIKSHVSASLQKQANICSSHGTQNTAADQEMQMLKLTMTTASGTGITQNTAYVKTAPTPAMKSVHFIPAKGTSPQTVELCPTSSEGSHYISKVSPHYSVSTRKPSSKSPPECMQPIATPGSQDTTAVVSSQHTLLASSQHTTAQSNSQNIVMSKTSQSTVPYRGTPHVNVTSDMQLIAPKGISQTSQTLQQVVSHNSNVTDGMENSLETPGHSRSVSHQFQTPSGKRAYPLPPTPPTAHKLKQMDHIVIKGKEYLKLELLGRGGSSKVYEVLDLETRKVKAVKLVELEGLDNATVNSYKNEISILQRLQWSDRVIRLYDYELSGSYLNLVMEKGNRDLASILSNARNKKALPISPFTIQHYWYGMLLAVQAIHQEGIIHSDLKPANFLLVNETVKLIDFGIASSIQQDMTSVIKDSQAGTFNYMSPESLLDIHSGPIINSHSSDRPTIKIGVKSDVWSLGCILYNLVYGRTPFQHISNPLMKLSAISDPNSKINFPDIENIQLKEVMQLCLQFDPHKRPSIQELLEHPYLTAQTCISDSSTPHKEPHLKHMIDRLAQLTPNSLGKITTFMMKQLHPDS